MEEQSDKREILTVHRSKGGKFLSVYKADAAPNKPELFTVLRNTVFFIAVYLYFIGWVYVYYFLGYFGISLSSVDTPVYYFFIYSYGVIQSCILWLLLAAALAAVAYVLSDKYGLRRHRSGLLVVVLVILFPVSFYAARRTALFDALTVRRGGGMTIRFNLKGAAGNYAEEFKEANDGGELTLVFQSEDRFYVLSQPVTEDKVLPIGYVFTVFTSDVQMATVELTDSPAKEVK